MNKTLVTTLIAALLTAPMAVAEWRAYGSHEPDTRLDDPLLMFFNPPGAAKTQVYFNAYTTAGTGAVNPNVGALRSSMEAVGTEYHMAVLGVWTDCNGDGYIGMAETAAREYRNELLLDKTLCPPQNGNQGRWPGQDGTLGYNNYNGWVTELIPIGSKLYTGAGDKRVIKDEQALVWGDYGRPSDSASAGGTCALRPFPRGTTQSTGGALNYVDCRTQLLEAWNVAVGTVDPSDSRGLRFQDDDDARGTFVDRPTFGSDDSSHTIVKAQDCNAAPLTTTGTAPPGDDFDNRPVRTPGVYANPGGTIPGTVNYTMEGLPLPKRETDSKRGPESTSNCDTSDDRGADFYGIFEDDFNGVSTQNKVEADWNFEFTTMTRGGAPLLGLGSLGAAGGPNDAGINGGGPIANQRSEWVGDSQLVKPPRLVRADVANVDVQPQNGQYFSFYAFVGPAVTGKGFVTPGGTGIYGAPQCEGATTGVKKGWNCDPTAWYINPDGSPMPETYPFARPGQPYNLRDVDCYDNTAARVGTIEVPAGVPSTLGVACE